MRNCLRPGARLALAAFLSFVFTSSTLVSATLDAAAATRAAPVVAANSAQSVIDGVDCPDIMVIAARGTQEHPFDWQNLASYSSDANKGAGPTLYSLYQALKGGNQGLIFSLDPVVYPTNVPTNLSQLNQYLFNDAKTGAKGIARDIQDTDAVCHNTVRYVLAGFSLGAWAVHDAVNQLSPAQRGEIAGVALFGDPKFMPFQTIVRDNQNTDIWFGMAALTIDQGNNTIPSALVARTGSWCLPSDPICQVPLVPRGLWPAEFATCVTAITTDPPNKQICTHLQYPDRGKTAAAAAFLRPFLPTSSLWPHLSSSAPPDGTVGVAYSWTATATPTTAYTWAFSGTLPPGLSLSAAGVLSGTPAQAGTFPFSITATGASGRFVTGNVTVTVNPAAGGGGGWTAAKAPLPANAGTNPFPFLTSVTCASVSSCVAVGGYDDSSTNGQGLLENLSGTTWTPTQASLPANAAANPQAGFQSAACASVSSCVAVGTYQDSSGTYHGLLETLTGTTWTATEAPLPSGAAACSSGCPPQLTSVTCTSATSCVAVGSYEVPGQSGGLAVFKGLIETLSGTTWTATETPLPAGSAASQTAIALHSVTCAAVSSCLAVGQYQDSSGNQQGLVETLAGTTWTATRAPLPGGAAASQTAGLGSAACPSAASCVAVGYYADSSGTQQGLVETLSGTTWTATEAPTTTAHNQASLLSVACLSASFCAAGGEYRDSSGSQQGLLETLSGTTWTAAQAPVPTGAFVNPNVNLYSVACPSTSCVAVGAYTSSSGNGEGLLEMLSGTAWTSTEAPLPAEATQTAGPVSVACPSVSSCIAVGHYTDSSGNNQGLLLTGPS